MTTAVEALAPLFLQSLTEITRAVAREEARRAALEVLEQKGAGPACEWLTQVKAAKLADVSPQTIREWLRAGLLGEPGRRGRVHLERLRAHLASSGVAPAPAGRGRQIAAAVLAAGGARR